MAPLRVTRRPVLTAIAVVALGVNLRTTVASLPPLVVEVERSLGLSGPTAGLLTALPVLCMAFFAPAAYRLGHRFGREPMALAAAGAIALGNGLRALGTETPLLFLATLVAGLGVAVAGVVIPGLVKEAFAHRPGAATGAYTVAMMLGATVAASVSVPLRDGLGSWQASLGFWGVPGLVAVGAWALVVGRTSPRYGGEMPALQGDRAGLPWRSRTAWLLVAFFSAQSSMAYAVLGWLSPSYEARGWTAGTAGVLLGVNQLAQLGAALALPALSDRGSGMRPALTFAGICTTVGLGWLVLAPEAAPWVLVSVLGVGLGGGFTLGLVMLVRHTPDPGGSSRLTAMVFLVSYTVAALAPVVVGAVRDATGGFTAAFAALLLLAAGQFVVGIRLTARHRQVG